MYLARDSANGATYLSTSKGRAQLASPYHASLFQRLVTKASGDEIETYNAAELDIIRGYLQQAS